MAYLGSWDGVSHPVTLREEKSRQEEAYLPITFLFMFSVLDYDMWASVASDCK